MKKLLILATMLLSFQGLTAQCTIWASTSGGSKNNRLYIVEGNTIWTSTSGGSKDQRLYIIDGETLWSSTSGGSKDVRILIAEGGCMGKISVLTCLLARL